MTEQEPEFLQPLDNLTATQGRDVSFTCVVNNLGQYRVSYLAHCIFFINNLKFKINEQKVTRKLN
jgi:hypothetical protein